jgi:hypothetical protein
MAAQKPRASVLGRDMFDRVGVGTVTAANAAPKPAAAVVPNPHPNAAKTTPAERRVGTISAPYQRADGQQTRQVSCTLPIDLVMRLELAATRRQVRVRDLIVEMIEQHYPAAPGELPAAPTPTPPARRGRRTPP